MLDKKLSALVRQAAPGIRDIRRHLHQNPEIRYKEFATAAFVERALRDMGLEVCRVLGTGVTALLRGRRGGKTVALRADIDGLEMTEQTGLPYASTNGCMHACGHDGHTAVLLGAAKVLASMRDSIPGNVKFIFQPAEELGQGGRAMCQAGVLEGAEAASSNGKQPRVGAIFALHGFHDFEVGTVGVSPGVVMANCDSLFITVHGRGGHGAHPDLAVDPVLIAARIIESLQSIVSREIDPGSPAVISITTMNGGSTTNIIPDKVELSGTIRSLTSQVRAQLFAGIRRVATQVARSMRGRAVVRIKDGYPATVNDDAMTQLVRSVGIDVVGARNVLPLRKISLGAEDFSYYLHQVPGCYFRLGLAEPGKPCPPLHNSRFDFNDKALPVGIKMMAGIALKYLQ